MLYAIATVLFIEMDDSLSIALGAVAVPFRLEIGAQLLVVINLSVVNDPDFFVFIGKRLMSGLHIDDAQATHGEAHVTLDKKTIVVGSTVCDLRVHLGEDAAIGALPRIGIEHSANTAHT